MGKLLLFILLGITVTVIVYAVINRFAPFKKYSPLNTWQTLLCWFIMLYVPVQLFTLMAAGQYMPIGKLHEHMTESVNFALGHGILSVMGMVVSKYFRAKHKGLIFLLIANAGTAIFYFMAALILLSANAPGSDSAPQNNGLSSLHVESSSGRHFYYIQ
jgi:hypothetical protein